MNINSAADLAAILDPEKVVPGLWKEIYFVPDGKIPMCPREFAYTGPADLHTAREHAWRMEKWLEAKGCSILRANRRTFVRVNGQYFKSITEDINHTAALLAAIERVSE